MPSFRFYRARHLSLSFTFTQTTNEQHEISATMSFDCRTRRLKRGVNNNAAITSADVLRGFWHYRFEAARRNTAADSAPLLMTQDE